MGIRQKKPWDQDITETLKNSFFLENLWSFPWNTDQQAVGLHVADSAGGGGEVWHPQHLSEKIRNFDFSQNNFHHRQLLVGAVSRGHLHHDTLAGHEEGGDEDEEDVVEEEGGEEDGADAQAR